MTHGCQHYHNSQKAYDNSKIIVSQNVTFDENQPAQPLLPPPSPTVDQGPDLITILDSQHQLYNDATSQEEYNTEAKNTPVSSSPTTSALLQPSDELPKTFKAAMKSREAADWRRAAEA